MVKERMDGTVAKEREVAKEIGTVIGSPPIHLQIGDLGDPRRILICKQIND